MSQGEDGGLADVLAYLQGLGWEEVYAPGRGGAAGPGSEGRTSVAAERPAGSSPAGGAAAPVAPRSAPRGTAEARPSAPTAATGAVVDLVGEVPAEPAARAARLAELGARAASCSACKLAAGRHTVVFGTGDPQADLMLIGEGPGAEEDRQGLPFVGPAGQLLTRIIQAIGLSREQVYIANVVKCRPPGNRDPQPDEVTACRGFLEGQIRLVQPKVIVALGRVAAQTLLGSDLPVGRMRGQWFDVLGVPVRVTYHPAAILRDASYKRPTWDDMQLVRDRLRDG